MEILMISKDLLRQYLDDSLIQKLVTTTEAPVLKLNFSLKFNCKLCGFGTEKMSLVEMHSLAHSINEPPKRQDSFAEETEAKTQVNACVLDNEAFADTQEKDFIPDSMKDFIPDSMKDFIPDSMKDFIPDSMKDFIPDSMKDFIPDSMKDFIPDSMKDFIPDSMKDFNYDAQENDCISDLAKNDFMASEPSINVNDISLETYFKANRSENDFIASEPSINVNDIPLETYFKANRSVYDFNADEAEPEIKADESYTDSNKYALISREENNSCNTPTRKSGRRSIIPKKVLVVMEDSDETESDDDSDSDYNADASETNSSDDEEDTKDNKDMKYNMQCKVCSKTCSVKDPESAQGYKCPDCCGDVELVTSMMGKTNISGDKENSAKVHQCDICLQFFSSDASVNIHKLYCLKDPNTPNISVDIPSNVNPHQCDMCHKSYKHPGALKKHMKVHQNDAGIAELDSNSTQLSLEEINSCYTPSKKSTRCSIIPKKVLVVTEDDDSLVDTFQCEHCNKRYASKASMMRHIKSMHTLSQSMIVK